jgi:PAS domain S-box-containing protein
VETFPHQLQKFDPGVVWLDRHNHIYALNKVAAEVLGANAEEIIGREILQFHPEKSRAKVKWLLDTAACPVEAAPPMTMMINIPDRILLIKVSKMLGSQSGAGVGTCMVFYDLTDMVSTPSHDATQAGKPRLLFKLPVSRHNRVMLVGLDAVVHFKAEGHYTTVYTRSETYLCNLSLSDLEERLDPDQFVRVHRSHMINMRFAKLFEKDGDHCTLVMDMPGEVAIPVSRGKVKMLKAMLGLD